MKNVTLNINSLLMPPLPQQAPPFPQSDRTISINETVKIVSFSVQFKDEGEAILFTRDLLNFINDYTFR